MKKTYKSKLRAYNIYVELNGSMVDVEFRKAFVINSLVGCAFSTENKDLQNAIESHHEYGLKFWTDDKEEVVDVKEEVKEEPKRVKRYKNKD
jgi:hypothetical protein